MPFFRTAASVYAIVRPAGAPNMGWSRNVASAIWGRDFGTASLYTSKADNWYRWGWQYQQGIPNRAVPQAHPKAVSGFLVDFGPLASLSLWPVMPGVQYGFIEEPAPPAPAEFRYDTLLVLQPTPIRVKQRSRVGELLMIAPQKAPRLRTPGVLVGPLVRKKAYVNPAERTFFLEPPPVEEHRYATRSVLKPIVVRIEQKSQAGEAIAIAPQLAPRERAPGLLVGPVTRDKAPSNPAERPRFIEPPPTAEVRGQSPLQPSPFRWKRPSADPDLKAFFFTPPTPTGRPPFLIMGLKQAARHTQNLLKHNQLKIWVPPPGEVGTIVMSRIDISLSTGF